MFEKRRHAYKKRRNHAARRAFERHGIHFSREDYRSLCKQIQNHNAERVEILTHTRSKYIVQCRGVSLTVVYSHATNQIVTVLP